MTSSNLLAPLRIAVLISGGGTTLHNLLEWIDAGRLNVEIALVISSSAKAKGLEFAREREIPYQVFSPQQFDGIEPFSEAIFTACREARVRIAVMGGFLKLIRIPEDFVNRVVNIHPGLIPAFCGPGFYGLRVHQAVLDYGAKISGCTVHFVDDQYDHGPILLQRVVDVLPDDTPEQLARRVFAAECEAYPEALNLIAAGRVSVEGRRVYVSPAAGPSAAD